MGDSPRKNGIPVRKNDESPAVFPEPNSTSPSAPKKQLPMKQLKSGCWNIRRGLIKRELEITNLLTTKKLDIFFLVETDTNMIHSENDYKIKGYKTVFPLKDGNNLKTRMICLTNESNDNIKTRPDLMDPKFPSIWCEEVREHEKNLLICGFYREWSHEGLKSSLVKCYLAL